MSTPLHLHLVKRRRTFLELDPVEHKEVLDAMDIRDMLVSTVRIVLGMIVLTVIGAGLGLLLAVTTGWPA